MKNRIRAIIRIIIKNLNSLYSLRIGFAVAFCSQKPNEHRRAGRWTALNYTSHYPFSRSKASSQQQAQSHTTKIINQVCCCCCCCATTRRALFSGYDPLGQPCFHGLERRVVSVHALSRCPGRLFPQEACSNASWQKSLISEPSGLVQADLTDDRVMMQCRRSRSVAAVLSSLFPE